MNRRGLLRRQLKRAWAQVLSQVYIEGQLNSERALQAYLAAHLLNAFQQDGVKRRLYIEPKVQLAETGAKINPDILVTNTRSVIAVIELKFSPKQAPRQKRDLHKLDSLAHSANPIELTNERYLGPNLAKLRFEFAADCLFVWAGVYRSTRPAVGDEDSRLSQHPNFMMLHALTAEGEQPSLWCDGRQLDFPLAAD